MKLGKIIRNCVRKACFDADSDKYDQFCHVTGGNDFFKFFNETLKKSSEIVF